MRCTSRNLTSLGDVRCNLMQHNLLLRIIQVVINLMPVTASSTLRIPLSSREGPLQIVVWSLFNSFKCNWLYRIRPRNPQVIRKNWAHLSKRQVPNMSTVIGNSSISTLWMPVWIHNKIMAVLLRSIQCWDNSQTQGRTLFKNSRANLVPPPLSPSPTPRPTSLWSLLKEEKSIHITLWCVNSIKIELPVLFIVRAQTQAQDKIIPIIWMLMEASNLRQVRISRRHSDKATLSTMVAVGVTILAPFRPLRIVHNCQMQQAHLSPPLRIHLRHRASYNPPSNSHSQIKPRLT